MMRKRLHEIIRDFENIISDISDIKNITHLFVENGLETGLDQQMQSILNAQLKLLEQAEISGERLEDKLDVFMHDYLHGKI